MGTKTKKQTTVDNGQAAPAQAAQTQTQTQIPLSAVPHMFNQKVLEWHEAQHQAMKEIYTKLDDLLEEIRRWRIEAKGRKE